MRKKRIFILGAGLAGLSAAWHLQRRGIDCQIFEKEAEVGGLCRSKKIGGFTFDHDGHVLHFKHRYTFNFIRKLLKNNLIKHQRSAWIYAFDKYIRYPFQVNLYGLPPSVVRECLLGFVNILKNNKIKDRKDLNFYGWINQTFGEGIAKHFMVPYNTKFWTLPPRELTCEWLDGFIPVPSLDQLLEGTIESSQRKFGYNSQFWYPKRGGIASLPLALASEIKNIHTHCKAVEIDVVKKEIRTSFGNKEKFDYLISTIPLPEMAHLINGMPKQVYPLFKKLRWNSIFNLNLGISQENFLGRHWIYFPQRALSFFRVGFFNNFSSHITPAGTSSLYAEVAYSKKKPIDKNSIVVRIKEDLRKAGILNGNNKICAQDVNDIEYGYPIYDINYSSARENIIKAFVKNDILPCGRYGSWRYLSMADTILDGKYIADSF